MIALPTARGCLSGFSPLSLSPALWLDAADASTLYDSTSGGSLVAADGAIARWQDKSGNNRHATQSDSLKRPLRKASIQNGRDVVLFDGSNDFLASVAFGGSETWTRFVVFASLVSQYKVIVAWASSFDAPNPGGNYITTNIGSVEWSHSGTTGTTKTSAYKTQATLQNGIFSVVTQQTDGTNAGHLHRLNGTTPTSTNILTSNPGTFTQASTAYGIGAYNGGSAPANCYVAEVIHYPAALSTANKQRVERYLGSKWGISVA